MAKENIQYYDEYKGLFRVREKDKEKFWRSSMFKVFRHYLLIIFILIIVTGNAAFSAIINQYQPVNREAIGETLGRAAYDRVKGIRGKIIGYEPTDYILNNETNTDIIIELHLLNIDVTRYFNKTVKEYTF